MEMTVTMEVMVLMARMDAGISQIQMATGINSITMKKEKL